MSERMGKVTPTELVSGVYQDDFTTTVEGFIAIGESLYVWNTKQDIAFIDEWAIGTDGLIEVEYDTFIVSTPTETHEVPDLLEFLRARM